MKQNIGIMGCGWLGTPLAKQLLELEYNVKGTTTAENKLDSLELLGISAFQLDLFNLDHEVLNHFLYKMDVLILTIPPNRSEHEPSYANNFSKLIPYLIENEIKQVVMMSSVSVYKPSKEVVTEDTKAFSCEQTAQQILAAENVLLNESAFKTCIMRLGGLFGNDREPVRYICAKEVLDNPLLPINMVHLDDIIQFSIAVLQQDLDYEAIFNIVSPHYQNRLDYYTQRAEINQLVLPRSGENNWALERSVSGDKITKFTELSYKF